MRKPQLAVLIFAILLVWKAISTDWVVSTPYWYYDSDPPASESISTYTFRPKSSPLWHPPKPSDYDESAKSWLHHAFFPIGGAWGPTQEPKLQIDYMLVGAKLAFAFLVIFPLTLMIRRFRPGSPSA